VLIYARDIRERLSAERRIRQYAGELEQKNRDLRDAQEQLVQTEKLASLGNLAAGICHEINNPIGSIVANSDVSRRALEVVSQAVPEPDAKVQRSMRILQELNQTTETAAKRIARIAASLRSFAHLDESERKRQDLHQGIEDALVLAQHTFGERIRIERRFAELPPIEHQPAKLNQVYMNVLLNAVEAIDGAGVITITTAREGDQAVVRVADTGRGIPHEQLDRIFDPGFTTRGVGVGTGLGLPISYRIMQEHGGKISVDSEPGAGATVTLRLPVA
jgi:signal transduction histidine kinase